MVCAMVGHMNTAFLSCALVLAVACSVDDRMLTQGLDCVNAGCGGSLATGGSTSAGGKSSGTGGRAQGGNGGSKSVASGGQSGDTGGTAGQGGVPAVDIVCPDLDDNTVPDCDETLAVNATFNTDVEGWRVEANATAIWSFINAQAGEKSGSIQVESNVPANTSSGDAFVYTGVTQCLALDAPGEHQIFAQMFSEGEAVTAYGSVVGRLFSSTDCSGSPTNTFPSLNQGNTSNWFPVQTSVFMADASARSLMVELRVGKLATRTGMVSLRFDNVFVR